MFVRGVFMFAKYASLLTEKLNKQMNFSDEEKEIYEYGFELLLSIVVTMAIVVSISLMLNPKEL